jgi:hypothetical protein
MKSACYLADNTRRTRTLTSVQVQQVREILPACCAHFKKGMGDETKLFKPRPADS